MPVTYFGKSSETDSNVDVFWRLAVGHSAEFLPVFDTKF